MKPLSHEEFNLLFEVRLVRSHALHEYTRLFEGELIRLCMRTHHGDVNLQPFWPLLFKTTGKAGLMARMTGVKPRPPPRTKLQTPPKR